MTISEWVERSSKYIDRLDAEVILTHYLQAHDRSYLVAHDDEELPDNIQQACDTMLAARMRGKPLAYILGYKEFYGRRFIVTPEVLIPRPETEDIIDLAKAAKPKNVVDVGTGSGCIAITLALELPNAEITAIDISDTALSVAQKNAKQLGAKIDFRKNNLVEGLALPEKPLIIANLPYVDKTWNWLDKNSLSYEPQLALYAQQEGLELIYRLINQLDNPCRLLLEADPSQHEQIKEYAKLHGFSFRKSRNFILSFAKNKTAHANIKT